MARRRTDAERRREVEGWRASSESVKKYAARRGYSETTLRKWIATENAGSRVPSAMPELCNRLTCPVLERRADL